MVDANRELHLSRLRDPHAAVPSLRNAEGRTDSTSFQTWRGRVKQSLDVFFGPKHHYSTEFNGLYFRVPAVILTESTGWTVFDEGEFQKSLTMSLQLLEDALEEADVPPPRTPSQPQVLSGGSVSPIVLNVTNVLSQSTTVQIAQVLRQLEELGLSPAVVSHAKDLATDLNKEIEGEQRWPVLGKILNSLQALGKPVYENVVIPLLLEMLKKQAGLQ